MTPRGSSGFRHLEFLKLSDKRILLILVTPEGDVQNRIILTEARTRPSELVEAANILQPSLRRPDVRGDQGARSTRNCGNCGRTCRSS
jgi:transcriptional regulator of heat shock response